MSPVEVLLAGLVFFAPAPLAVFVAGRGAARLLRAAWWHALLVAAFAAVVGVVWAGGPAAAARSYARPYRALTAAAKTPEQLRPLVGREWAGWLAGMAPLGVPVGLAGVAGGLLVDQLRRPAWRPPAAGRRRGRGRRAAVAAGRCDRPDRVVLGVGVNGRAAWFPTAAQDAHGLVVGASGSGKTTTLLTIAEQAVAQGRGLVFVDLKAGPTVRRDVAAVAARHGREFVCWSLTGPAYWNPLARGDYSQRVDKLIAVETWTEAHYKRLAERHLQWILRVLEAAGETAPTLGQVCQALDLDAFDRLLAQLESRDSASAVWAQARGFLETVKRDRELRAAVTGFGSRYALLAESTAGRWLNPHLTRPASAPSPSRIVVGPPPDDERPAARAQHEPATAERSVTPPDITRIDGPGNLDEEAVVVDLFDALAAGSVVLFSLDSLAYPERAAQVGGLVLQDLTAVGSLRLHSPSGRRDGVVMVDEFSALDGDQMLGLLARGREAGIGCWLSTQELADLAVVSPTFTSQALGNTAIKIVHRQQVPSSAEVLAGAVGTRARWAETVQVEHETGLLSAGRGAATGLGSLREVEEFVVHPNQLRRLGQGEAVVIQHHPSPRAELVQVIPRRSVP